MCTPGVLARKFLVLMFLASAARAFACDVCVLDFIGSSADGKSLAFTDTCGGCETDAGRTLRIVDVATNRVVASPGYFEPDDQENYPLTWRKATAAIDRKLATFGIVRGLTGSHVVSHPQTDLSADPHHVRFRSQRLGNGPWQGLAGLGDFELALTIVPTTCPRPNFEDPPAAMFRLAVTNLGTSASSDLQVDRRLPASRGCAFAYSIGEVFVLGDHVAVFLRLESPGFEGSDTTHMVVTGRLP